MIKITVITHCKGCGETVTLKLDDKVDYRNGIQSCPKCDNMVSNESTKSTIIQPWTSNNVSAAASIVGNCNNTVVVKTAEEIALDELKKFCIV